LKQEVSIKSGDFAMYRTTILSAAPVVGALLATSPTAQASLIGYTFTEIEVPGSIDMSPDAINNLGQIVGTYTDDAGNGHGFLEKGGKYVNVDVAGALFTAPAGINDLGQIVGIDLDNAGNIDGFLDTRGTFTTLSTSGSASGFSFSGPLSINDKGEILWQVSNSFGFPGSTHAALEEGGVFTLIDVPGAVGDTAPGGLNNFGQIVGSYGISASGGYEYGFLDTNGVFTTIDDPNAGPRGYTQAFGLNDWGQVVGSYCDSAGACHGFLDTNGHFTTIDAPGSSEAFGGTEVTGINDEDQLLEVYFDAAGNPHALLATPHLALFSSSLASSLAAIPEASTWAMLLLGFAGLGCAGYRLSRRSAVLAA
jgi:probable HAF family extracellular repeat protein